MPIINFEENIITILEKINNILPYNNEARKYTIEECKIDGKDLLPQFIKKNASSDFTLKDLGADNSLRPFGSNPFKKAKISIISKTKDLTFIFKTLDIARQMKTKNGLFGLTHLFLLEGTYYLHRKAKFLAEKIAEKTNQPADALFKFAGDFRNANDYDTTALKLWEKFDLADEFFTTEMPKHLSQDEIDKFTAEFLAQEKEVSLGFVLTTDRVPKNNSVFYLTFAAGDASEGKSWMLILMIEKIINFFDDPIKFSNKLEDIWIPKTGYFLS